MAAFWNVSASTTTKFNKGDSVCLAGRVVSFRRQGGVAFGHLYDGNGKLQFCFQKRIVGDLIKEWSEQIQLGVHIGISGEFDFSSTGEPTIFVKEFKLLQTVWRSFPDKHLGIASEENKIRKRYLSCVFDSAVNNVFRTRSIIISSIRKSLNDAGFLEFETPILTPHASGAQAKPFTTHHNTLGADLFMRIAPETYLKRVVAAGFNNVFELGKQFRNEGIDPSHLQEFTSVEWYAAYWNYIDNLNFFNNFVLKNVIEAAIPQSVNQEKKSYTIPIGDKEFELSFEPNIVKYRDLFHSRLDAYPDSFSAKEADNLFKERIRGSLTHPTYVIDYPAHMSPMAARRSDDFNTVEQWQLIINGWEIVKCYTELTDPVLQRKLLEEQMRQKQAGNDEAMTLEEDFLECMEHGMPPMSGLGMGIDRLICLLTNQKSLKDVVMFPTTLSKV
jgi:lysyl-tRNA synthetase class 2